MSFLENRRARPVGAAGSGTDGHPSPEEGPAKTAVQAVTGGKGLALEATEPRWRLEELILAAETLEAIREAADAIRAAPLVESWLGDQDRVGRRMAVNFYGPPGTGKTSAADALASLLRMKIIKVPYADLESRFVGDTPKNLRTAFRQARDAKAVLFFDEADSILSRRFGNLTQANEAYINQTRSTMLLELEAFEGVVIFATNMQGNYDDAFIRRIAAHVRFTLPDPPLRTRLWQKYLPDTLPRSQDVGFSLLTELSDGLSPADIAAAVRRAAVRAAVRPETVRYVTLQDLRHAVEKIRVAKQEVGSRVGKTPVSVATHEIRSDELPPGLER